MFCEDNAKNGVEQAVLWTLGGWATLRLWWLLLGGKPNFFCEDEGTNGKACSELFQIGREWVMGGNCGVEQSNFVEDEISKVAEGEDGLHPAVAQEEGDTYALDKEVE
jgi:hypothetical protein